MGKNSTESQKGSSNGPKEVLLSLERKCVTTRRGILGILTLLRISNSTGATYLLILNSPIKECQLTSLYYDS